MLKPQPHVSSLVLPRYYVLKLRKNSRGVERGILVLHSVAYGAQGVPFRHGIPCNLIDVDRGLVAYMHYMCGRAVRWRFEIGSAEAHESEKNAGLKRKGGVRGKVEHGDAPDFSFRYPPPLGFGVIFLW